jgi:phosphoglycolate phosphatase-like HAD superfamily hydrolase
MLGDTPYDVEAARRAGVHIVALECGGWSAADLSGADEVYADPADLLHRYDASILARIAAAPTRA